MPVDSTRVRTIKLTVANLNQTPIPAEEDRNFIVIQNNGPRALNYRFGGPTTGDGGDQILAVGNKDTYDKVVPIDSLNFRCPGGTTTVSVVLGTSPILGTRGR